MLWAALYVASVVIVNIAFSALPVVETPLGAWPPASLLVGLVFVVRDLAQRRVGHWVIVAMLLGAGLSYWMADPYIAVASAAAFTASELVDWLVYTVTKRPLRDRILLSSGLSTPVDTVVFLGLIGLLSWPAALLMTASKMVGALAVYCLIPAKTKGEAA